MRASATVVPRLGRSSASSAPLRFPRSKVTRCRRSWSSSLRSRLHRNHDGGRIAHASGFHLRDARAECRGYRTWGTAAVRNGNRRRGGFTTGSSDDQLRLEGFPCAYPIKPSIQYRGRRRTSETLARAFNTRFHEPLLPFVISFAYVRGKAYVTSEGMPRCALLIPGNRL